ncbi:DUF445 domain-containing protein [Flavihumibacter stibioxidans]|uniref:DUF445 domain-containing protein n=1 Tax=Flavihumibacter stibioxidans TaxID=1834163 RepID=A0ABR7M4R4_9BACT|nr:DUF445 family protein [Flavihumibacter stibioxidans]MBC6489854.1 DUF445 domain-containing protein [Flavihumibacter stibioxidans]
MNYWLILIPVISAFIGWFTNWIAIKMLFHPRRPMNILGLTVQGIFPKRQQQFAEKLGRLVSEELLSFKDIAHKITDPSNIDQLLPMVDEHIEHFLKVKLKETMPMISMFIGDKTIAQLKGVFMEELKTLFPVLMDKYMENLQDQLDLEKIVVEKVSNFSSDKLEEILMAIMAKEFRFVEILGGVVGLLIGIVQVAITLLTTR